MNVIRQSATFNATPRELFRMYTDSKRHSEATGAPCRVSSKQTARFTAFGGMISGQNVMVVPDRLIVQRWRSKHFHKIDPDSVLILQFSETSKGCRVDLVHVGVPDQDFEGVKKGWPSHYWKPWRAYLKRRP